MEGLKLTGSQLCVAGQIAGYSHLLLPRDPFRGWLVEEMTEELDRARLELSQAGFLNGGNRTLTEPLHSIVDILAEPQTSWLVNRTLSSSIEAITYHAVKDGLIRISQHVPDEYQISILEGAQFSRQIVDFLGIEQEKAARSERIEISAERLKTAREKIASGDRTEGQDLLIQSGLGTKQASNLTEALDRPRSSGSIIKLSWQKKQARQDAAIAFLNSREGLIEIIESQTQPDWVVLSPVSGRAIVEKIESMLEIGEKMEDKSADPGIT